MHALHDFKSFRITTQVQTVGCWLTHPKFGRCRTQKLMRTQDAMTLPNSTRPTPKQKRYIEILVRLYGAHKALRALQCRQSFGLGQLLMSFPAEPNTVIACYSDEVAGSHLKLQASATVDVRSMAMGWHSSCWDHSSSNLRDCGVQSPVADYRSYKSC